MKPLDDLGRHLDPLAKIHPTAVIGADTAVWAFASVHDGVSLGDHCMVGEHVYIGRGTTIGARTRIQQGSHITDHMRIGERVFIGPRAVFVNDRHPMVNNPRYRRESPTVEDDVAIGGGATILPGVRLGRGCVIGAGAVVTKDVPPYQTWVGNPARRLPPRTVDPTDHEAWCRAVDGQPCNCHPAFVGVPHVPSPG